MRSLLMSLAILLVASGCDMKALFGPPMAGPPARPPQRVNIGQQLEEIDEQLKLRPDDLNLLKSKAILLQSVAARKVQEGRRDEGYADYELSGELWRKVKAQSPELNSVDASGYSVALYNQACALSLKKEIEPALTALRESLEAGFEQTNLLTTDSDLDNLRDHAEFKAITEDLHKFRLIAARKLVSSEPLFPFEFDLPNLDGKQVSSKDYLGKVIIVDFWGTWCGPCVAEIPHFVKLHQKHRDQGFDMVGINYENGASSEEKIKVIRDFKAISNVSYECLLGDSATSNQVPGFGAFPTTLFIDRQGKVRAKLVGGQSYEVLEGIVEVLLAEPSLSVEQ
jgi:thiol-disulfide isomerase/thioredoxin